MPGTDQMTPRGVFSLSLIVFFSLALFYCLLPCLPWQMQEVQHLRFEFFARSRELRRLLHMALVTDEALFEAHMPASQPLHLQGHLRFSAAVCAAGKVLDRMTTVARCALEAGGRM